MADCGPGSVGGGLVVTPGGAWRRFTLGWRILSLLGAALQGAGEEGSVGVHPAGADATLRPAEPVSPQPTEPGPWRGHAWMGRVVRAW